MGYFYENGTWDGAGYNGGTGSYMGHIPTRFPNDPRGTESSLNYILLYNKYTTVLRVLAYIENGTGFGSYNTIVVQLHLLNPANYAYSPGSVGFPYNQTYNPKVNALFNVYNNGSIMHGLDQPSDVATITAPASFPYGTTNQMFYADFQLAYDPCVCFFQSGIRVDFSSKMNATFTATGQYAGTVAPYNMAASAVGNGNVYGSGSGEDFIASIFENGNSPTSMIQTYNNLKQLKADKQDELNQKAQLATALGLMADVFSLAAGSGLVTGTFNILNHKFEYKDALEKGSMGLEFLSGRLKEKQEDPEPNLSIASGYMNLNGTVSFDESVYNGIDLIIGTPGSKDAGILPEYSKVINAEVLPNYPMYNESTGLFTLLNTPKVNSFSSVRSVFDEFVQTPVEGTSLHVCKAKWHKEYKWSYSLAQDFIMNYKFNPIVDEARSNIYVGFEIKGVEQPTENDDMAHLSDINSCYYWPEYPWQPRINVTSEAVLTQFETNSMEAILTNTNGSRNYMSRFFPISCHSNMVSENHQQLDLTYRFSDNYCDFQKDDCFKLPADGNDFFRTQDIRLVVLLDLQSKPDAYGKAHKMFQIQKYKCDINTVTTDPLSAAPLNIFQQAFQAAANNLNQGAHSFISGIPLQEIYSFGNITVTGDQYLAWSNSHKANLIAEKEIYIQGEVSVSTAGDDLSLKIQSLPSEYNDCSSHPLAQADAEFISSWCNNSDHYRANQLTNAANDRLMAKKDSKEKQAQINRLSSSGNQSILGEQTFGKDYKIGVFPNPTTSNITVSIFAAGANNIVVSLEDIIGKELLNNSFKTDKGYSQNQINLSELVNGIYLVKISDNQGNLLKTEKIILNK